MWDHGKSYNKRQHDGRGRGRHPQSGAPSGLSDKFIRMGLKIDELSPDELKQLMEETKRAMSGGESSKSSIRKFYNQVVKIHEEYGKDKEAQLKGILLLMPKLHYAKNNTSSKLSPGFANTLEKLLQNVDQSNLDNFYKFFEMMVAYAPVRDRL